MSSKPNVPVFGTGRFLKTCTGCKKEFRTDARNARYGPPELCKCLERKAKLRTKRRKERAKYRKNPEKFRALSAARALSRKNLIEHYKKNDLIPACRGFTKNGPCSVRGWNRIKDLHAHHNDHNPFNDDPDVNTWWYCRRHHEHADHAVDHGSLVLYVPRKRDWIDYLVHLRTTNTRKFFTVSVHQLWEQWLLNRI